MCSDTLVIQDPLRTSIVICITRLENAILQVEARFVEQRRQPRRTSASTCKTFKAKYNNFC
jgi:hypothetical protein